MSPEQTAALKALKEKATRAHGGECKLDLNGWRFLIDQGSGGMPGWHLSASLFPMGRSSVEADWRFIGEAAAALGAPEDSLLTPIETTHPNDPLHWHWDAPPEAIEVLRFALAQLTAKRAALRAAKGSAQ